MNKKSIFGIACAFIGILVAILIILWILSLVRHHYYTYAEVEQKMIDATTKFYKENPEILPVNDGRSTLAYNTLVENNMIAPLNELLKDGDTCSAEMIVVKKDNNYSYIPKLSCSDKYSTIELADQIKINSPVVTQNSGLYSDNMGGYYFRGKIDNNYLTLGTVGTGRQEQGLLWRIMSIEPDGRVKIIATKALNRQYAYDNRYNEGQKAITGYNDFEMSILKETLLKVEKDEVPLTEDQKTKLAKSKLCIGTRSVFDESKDGSTECSILTQDEMMFGVMVPYEYMRASLDDECKNMYDLSCQNFNYLSSTDSYSSWSLTRVPTNDFEAYSFEGRRYSTSKANVRKYIYLTAYLNSYTMFKSGDGTQTNPYVIY